MFNLFSRFLMEEANGGDGGAGGAAAAAPNIGEGNPPNQGAGSGNNGNGSGAGGAATTSWLDTLPDDIKKDPSLASFKDPSSLAKSWVNAQKMIGADKVVIPGDNASDEEKAAFYAKIGRPESADKYAFKLPDGQKMDPTFEKGLREVAHKNGLTSAQLQGLVDWHSGAAKAAIEAQQVAQTNQLRDELKSYAEKLGGDEKYKARVEEARVAVRSLASPELKEFLVKTGMGSRPEMIELFASLHKMMSDGKVRDGTGVAFQDQMDPVAIQREIDAVEKNLYDDKQFTNPSRASWLEQRNKLYERLNHARSANS